jgi:ABC-2 type transport system permease protein
MAASRRLFPAFFRAGFKNAVAYRGESLVWILSTTMPFVMMLLWREVGAQGGIANFNAGRFQTYFLLMFCVRQLAGSWVSWKINAEVKSGALGLRLLKPVHPFQSYLAEELASLALRAMMSLPPAVVLLLLFGENFPRDPWVWACALLSLVGAWLLTFSVGLIMGLIALFTAQSTKLIDLWTVLFFVFGGYLVPQALFPHSVQQMASVLPFRFQLGLCVELASGSLSANAARGPLALQFGYVALFLLLARAVYRKGVQRFEAYGG